jgi:hypothetical protein
VSVEFTCGGTIAPQLGLQWRIEVDMLYLCACRVILVCVFEQVSRKREGGEEGCGGTEGVVCLCVCLTSVLRSRFRLQHGHSGRKWQHME